MMEDIPEISKRFISNIKDVQYRNVLIVLLNKVEEQSQRIEELKQENQKLKDEINRLKGEQGKPKFIKSKSREKQALSSEQERKQEQKWEKQGKKEHLEIDQEIKCKLSEEELKGLPKDVRLLRYERLIEQDVKLVRKNTSYLLGVYYSAKEKKTYRAKLPESYSGYFGNHLKSLAHVLTHQCDVSQSKLLELFRSSGISISSGSLNNILQSQARMYEREQEQILLAGLSGNYCGIDSTGSKQKGERLYTQIVNNDKFSVFISRKHKSRQAVLSVLQSTKASELQMSYNEEAKALMKDFKLSQKDRASIDQLLKWEKVYTKKEIDKLVSKELPPLRAKKNMYHRLEESLAIGHYHQQTESPVIKQLISDDAGEYKKIASQTHALCWVHDGRAYKRLNPRIQVHHQVLERFLKRYWKFYHQLLDYKTDPNQQTAQQLKRRFNRIFTPDTMYFPLNEQIEKTQANKKQLMAVLDNPCLPLHNNASELAARRVVSKRNISLHTMNEQGTKIRDAAMSIIQTAKKLKVNVIDYLNDRISGKFQMTPLPDLILLDSS